MKKNLQKKRRKARVRAKIANTTERLRLSVFRSSKHIYVQLIDDSIGKTLVSASDFEIEKKEKQNKTEIAKAVGELIAKKIKEIKIYEVVFDKGPYLYHGRIKSLAEGARSQGLKF
jgi:large subunit ribosomal protein L18